jgi:ubiquinone/menaquinone biosynthesis C-methylase UbiE
MPHAISDKPSAFDQVAFDYDRQFADTQLARALRNIVWERLQEHTWPGMRVLEIGCGTGEDAVWLAERGARVMATDISPAMLEVTRQKAERAGVVDRIDTLILDASSPAAGFSNGEFEMAVSNFGALNCVPDLHPLASAMAAWLRPGGWLVVVFINRWCGWEIAWHVTHGQPRVAFRRLRRRVKARVGEATVPVWYPSVPSIRRVLAPHFMLRKLTGLGAFLPPSYLEPVVARRPRLLNLLARLEWATATVFPFYRLADHVILEFQRTDA